MESCRLDKWLWGVRRFKTRAGATEACRSGRVFVGEIEAKPARDLRVGDIVTVREAGLRRAWEVLGLPASRVGAKLVPNYCADRTSPDELEKARLAREAQASSGDWGGGRPTKRDRRKLDDLRGIL
jgi:ribosome-associated heat shock protein Hsp15